MKLFPGKGGRKLCAACGAAARNGSIEYLGALVPVCDEHYTKVGAFTVRELIAARRLEKARKP